MKKLILLGLVTMITFSASAQIEIYTEKKTSQKSSSTPSCLFSKEHPFVFVGDISTLNNAPNLIGDTLFSIQEKLFDIDIINCALTLNAAKDTIRIKQLPIGEKFYVKDIISYDQLLTNNFGSKVFVSDTFYHDSFKKGRYLVPKIVTPQDSYDKLPVWEYFYHRKDKIDYSMFLKHSMPSVLEAIYVLENKGVTYFVRFSFDSTDGHARANRALYPPINTKFANTYKCIYSTHLSSFISVNSYNFIKENYVGKEVYYYNGIKRKSFKESLELYKFEKVLVKDGGLYGELRSSVNDKKVLTPIGEITTIKISAESNFAAGLIELTKQDQSKVLDGLGQLAINESKIAVDSIKTLSGHGRWCIKSDADSLLAKWAYEEEQVALAKKKQQSQYKDEMIRKYGEKFGSLIVEGKVCLDMTKEMCLEALGYPCEENSSETALGKFDIWTYDCLWYNAGLVSNLTYITFTDGKISGITN